MSRIVHALRHNLLQSSCCLAFLSSKMLLPASLSGVFMVVYVVGAAIALLVVGCLLHWLDGKIQFLRSRPGRSSEETLEAGTASVDLRSHLVAVTSDPSRLVTPSESPEKPPRRCKIWRCPNRISVFENQVLLPIGTAEASIRAPQRSLARGRSAREPSHKGTERILVSPG
ncbi:hypothetical protein BD311DRAFT_139510 [Dichomitus squalens]|uniref:Uncharacterized protein n=1 Tax=Dichomitus squalens TaxID=114155 RepID=A0A4Q9MA18_9APHY|nr:hypothetical protein BD311DRAFT_139510 [Dichomitus squalens]